MVGYGKPPVIDAVGFELKEREILALIGPNGAGKSTLLRGIDGLIKPQGGRIAIDGRATAKMSRRQMAAQIAYVPQTVACTFPFRVFDMVLLGRYPHGGRGRSPQDLERASHALRLLGVEELAMKNFTEISGGQQQKVAIARAIAQDARILLLDEPTSSLDIRHQLEVMELLQRLVASAKMAVIVSMHDLNLAARYADRIVLLDRGRIVADGEPFAVLTADNILAVYKVQVAVREVAGRPQVVPLKPLAN